MKKFLQTLALAVAIMLPWAMNAQTPSVIAEGFEGGSLPSGWTTSGAHDWEITNSPNSESGYTVTSAHGGSYCASFIGEGSDDNGQLTSPVVDLSTATAPQISFWYLNPDWGGDQNTLTVKYSTDGGTTWTTAQTFSSSVTNWTEVTLNLPATAATSTFKVQFDGYDGYGYDILLDDIYIGSAPTCIAPSALSLLSVSTTDATIGWTENGTATQWEFEYSASSFTPGDNTATNATVSENSISLSNLTLNTTYYYALRSVCSSSDVSAWVMGSFRTPASDPATLPYSCNFDNPDDTTGGFEIINGTQSNYWMLGTIAGYSGGNALFITNNGSTNGYSNSSTSYTYATRDLVFPDNSDYAITYDWRNQGESANYDFIRVFLAPASETFQAGSVLGNSTYQFASYTLPAGWVDLSGHTSSPWTLSQSSSWQTNQVVFHANAGAYKLVFAWANDNSGGSNPAAAVDNISLVQLSCPQPQNVAVVEATSSSLEFSWTAGGSETEWAVRLNNEDEQIVSNPTVIFTDLNPNTPYTFYVRSVCGSDDTSFVTTLSARTACGLITQLPFTETFETVAASGSSTGSATIPCWNLLNNGTTYGNYPYVSNSTTYNHTSGGSKGLYWYNSTTTGTYGDYQCLILPEVDPDFHSVDELMVSFWAKASDASYHPVFYVGVISNVDSLSTFQALDTINVVGTAWVEYESSLSGYEGEGNRIAIMAVRPSSYWYAYVDDITIAEIPACAHPIDAAVLGVTDEEITISWKEIGDATSWMIEYDDVNFTPGNDAAAFTEYVSDTVFTLTNLTPGTHYYIYISSDCGGSYSSAISVEAVTLAGAPAELPYSTNFDSIGSWNLVGLGQTNHWALINGTLSVTSDDVNNGYNTSSVSHSYAYLPVSVEEAGTYVVSFDWACAGESSWDFIRAFLAPAGSQFTPGVCPDGVTTSSNTFGVSVPTGWIALDGANRLNGQATMQSRSMDVSITTPGTYFVVFYWGNDGSGGSNPAGMIDNFTMMPLTCPYVTNVEVSNVAGTSAFLTWEVSGLDADAEDDEDASYTIVLNDENGTSTSTTATSSPIFLTGLDPQTNYSVHVSRLCNGDNMAWDSVSFHTGCIAGGDVVMGTGVAQTSGVPVNSAWGNTACQSIYTVAELQAAGLVAGPINGISYTWTTSNSYDKDFTIFINTTSASSYTTATGSSFQTLGNQVYTGSHPTGTTGSVDYYFTTPYVWDGTSNIVVTTFMNQPNGASHSSSGFSGLSTSTSATRTLYSYKDSNPYTTSNLSASSNVYTSTYRPSVAFLTPCDSNVSCAAPNVVLTEIGADDAEIIWAAGNGESSWEVAHKLVSENDWTIDAPVVTATSYTFSNLTPSSDYMFRVSHVCGGETYERIVTGSTVCVPVQVPLYENFETWVSGSTWGTPAAPCWTKFNEYSTSTDYPYVTTYLGSKSMYFYGPSSGGTDGIILPAIENGIDSLQISFQLAYSSANYGVAVGVMTDPSNIATFTQVATAVISQANVWNNFEISLSNYHGTGKYIAIFPISGSYNYCYLDNIEVTYIPTCPRPTNVVASNMTQTTANISWVDTATTEFEVEYGPAGFDHGQGTVVSVSGATTTTLTGLQHSTVYDVYVRGICSGYDTSSWSFVNHFVTACGALDVFPFTETFDNWGTGTTVHAPQCWTYGSDYSTTYPYISTTHNSGVGSMYFYDYNGTNSTAKTWLMMPAIDTTIVTMNQMMVSFNIYSSTSSYQHPLAVGVSSVEGDMSTFVAIDTVYPVYGEWNFHEVYFDQYAGTGKYVTFAAFVAPGDSYSYPYLDDVTLEMIPSCGRPDHLTASNATSSTVDLGWNDRGNPSNWIIEYGPQGFELGTGTTVIANSNPFTLTNLPSSYVGEYYVRALCSVGDTSPYSRQACLFSTSQMPAAVPYSYDFENAAEFDNWQQSTNPSSDVHWVRGTLASSTLGAGSNGMYCTNDDSTAAYVANVTNATIYRDIDFGTTDTSFVIGFDAYMGGSPVAAYDGLMVFLVDPSVPVVSTDANITTPWGNVNDLYRIAQVRYTSLDNNGWTRFEGTFDNLSGVHRVAFFWFHQGATTNFVGDMAMVDNISINYASCPRPTEVQATNVTATNATLTWRGPSTANYEVIYRIAGGQNNFVPTTTNSITLNNLQANSTYYVWVRKVCGAGDTSLTSDLFRLATPQILAPLPYFCGFEADEADECGNWGAANNGANDWYIGTATADSGSYSLYISNDNGTTNNYDGTTAGYSYAYRDFSFGNMTAQDTVVISFDWRCNGESSFDYLKVFFGQLNDVEGVLGSGTDYQPENTMDLSGAEYGFSGGRMNLQTSYTTATWMIPGDQITPGNNRLYFCWRNDASVTNNPAISIDNLSVIAPGASCGVPVITNVTNDFATATISWTGAGNDYEVAIKAVSEGMWPAETAVQGYTHTFTGLDPSTEYQFRVRQNCDTIGYSDWAMGFFTTDSLPCFAPSAVTATPAGTSVDLNWTNGGNETQWVVKVWNTAFADSVVVSAKPYTFQNLTSGTQYYAAVAAYCGNGAVVSDWSDAVSFTTTVCTPVSNVAASNVTNSSAKIAWTSNSDAAEWEVTYGTQGFGQGEGTTVTVTAPEYTINGLYAETSYDVYVRAICGTNYISEWSEKVTFTTSNVGINEVSGLNVNIYPNPATTATTITLSGMEGEVEVSIVDMTGRKVMNEKMECAGDCVKTINVDNLAQGAYFVRIQANGTNMVKKLIVK